jgi:hypothetical protein
MGRIRTRSSNRSEEKESLLSSERTACGGVVFHRVRRRVPGERSVDRSVPCTDISFR